MVGKAWDMFLGGNQFDSVLIEKMADAFNAKGYLGKDGDVRTLPKAMTKIKKNAQKVRCAMEIVVLTAPSPMPHAHCSPGHLVAPSLPRPVR